jgi:hypothetical protein
MPKISPRPEITGHPLYQATMAAQHAAYQLMREVPADRKADATRLPGTCIHATTWATYALDVTVAAPEREQAWRELAKVAAEGKARLAPLADLAADAAYPDTVSAKLDEIAAAAEAGSGAA